MCSVVFAGDIDALKDCWLVGDEFLKEISNAFQGWKSSMVAHNEEMPYL